MSSIVKWWRAESAMIVAVALAIVGAGVVSGIWQRVLLGVLPLVAGGAVRQTVWAPDTVAALTATPVGAPADAAPPPLATPVPADPNAPAA